MNNGKMWCVVNPTVGIPAFLGGVALIAFTLLDFFHRQTDIGTYINYNESITPP